MNVTLLDDQDDPLEPSPLTNLAVSVMVAEGLPDDTELAIHIVDVERITELNEGHLGKAGPTDVLSFPIESLSPGELPAVVEGGPPPTIGDVLICPAVVRQNADRAGIAFDDELALMVVHGLLHLLGYDDATDAERAAMRRLEDRYLEDCKNVKRKT